MQARAVMAALPPQLSTTDQQHLACQVCGKPCNSSFPCKICEALCYCSNKHRQLHRRLGHDEAQCSRMKQQLLRSQGLSLNQLQWPTQTSEGVCRWLQQLQCHEQGLLQHCCPMHPTPLNADDNAQSQQSHSDSHHDKPNHAEPQGLNAGHLHPTAANSSYSSMQWACLPCSSEQWKADWAPLSPASTPCWRASSARSWDSGPACTWAASNQGSGRDSTAQQAPPVHGTCAAQQQQQQQNLPTCWKQYCISRQIPESSPAALVLHFPLTLWYCLTQLLPQHGWSLPPLGEDLQIIYLGPRSELLLLPAFMELSMLLPAHHIQLHMVGPDVPHELHGRRCSSMAASGSVSISCWSGCWHDMLEDWKHAASNTAHHAQHQTIAAVVEPQEPAVAAQKRCPALPSVRPSADQTLEYDGRCLSSKWTTAEAPQGQLHLVFAANAGLPAFPAWVATLQQLDLLRHKPQDVPHNGAATDAHAIGEANIQPTPANVNLLTSVGTKPADGNDSSKFYSSSSSSSNRGVPVLFSDYCEEAAVSSQQMVEGLLSQCFDLQCSLNPFRQPVALCNHGTRLPAFSNGFLFGWL